MATADLALDYPTSDGQPMAETDLHRDLMVALIDALAVHFAKDPQAYVSGNMLLFYESGNPRKHVSPDVFVSLGVPKHKRKNYLVWMEGKGPDVVFEITSSSTRKEDKNKKFALYRDVLKVREYFLFDPYQDYLDPALQGYRLVDGEYVPIALVDGRIPSEILGLHVEQVESVARLYDPRTGKWLPTSEEVRIALDQAEAEVERLRQELAELRRKP